MDDRVRTLLERVRETATTVGEAAESTARYAGKYASQMVDIAKLNMQIFDLNGECNELLRTAGQAVYDTHLGKETDDDALSRILTQLDQKRAAIDELKGRIAVLKNSKACPNCGTACGQEDKFCKSCGKAL